MSFAAGMGAGMGAGIGSGIAIGVASGQKRAVGQIREYLATHEMTIHDSTGKEVQLDTVLNEALAKQGASTRWVTAALIVALLAGVALFSTILYFALL